MDSGRAEVEEGRPDEVLLDWSRRVDGGFDHRGSVCDGEK